MPTLAPENKKTTTVMRVTLFLLPSCVLNVESVPPTTLAKAYITKREALPQQGPLQYTSVNQIHS